jgi:2TM family of unknown function (DUF5676)
MTNNSEHQTPRLRIYTLGMSLGILLAVSFVLCVAFGLLFPGATMYQAWLPLLPGFKWISLPGFLLGLVETFAYGWYIALVFVPVFNFFSRENLK